MTLEIDNVELNLSSKKILSGVYLKSVTGEVTGILGRNGSGKSCLLKIIFGDLKPKFGLVRIDKKAILKPLYRTGIIGYLPQEHFIPKHLKLKTVFRTYQVNWEEFIEYFNEFKKYKNYKIKNLSWGERRMVEIYLILKKNYNIVLLDEPFSHLSPLHIQKIIELIKEEKLRKAIVVSDHMYKYIIHVSDSLYLLKNSCTISIDSIEDLEDYGYLNKSF